MKGICFRTHDTRLSPIIFLSTFLSVVLKRPVLYQAELRAHHECRQLYQTINIIHRLKRVKQKYLCHLSGRPRNRSIDDTFMFSSQQSVVQGWGEDVYSCKYDIVTTTTTNNKGESLCARLKGSP